MQSLPDEGACMGNRGFDQQRPFCAVCKDCMSLSMYLTYSSLAYGQTEDKGTNAINNVFQTLNLLLAVLI